MGIDSVKGMGNTSGRLTDKAQPEDSVIKGIQEEISEVQRQRKELSSKEELSATEKVKKRQELQQKISGLNRELRQRQTDVRRENQRENLMREGGTDSSGIRDTDKRNSNTRNTALKAVAGQNPYEDNAATDNIQKKLTRDNGPKKNEVNTNHINKNLPSKSGIKTADIQTSGKNAADEKAKTTGQPDGQSEKAQKTGILPEKAANSDFRDKSAQDKASQLQDFDIPEKTWKAVVKSDALQEQARKQETVIARIKGGIAILKSEIKLDETRGADAEKKREELKKQNEKLLKVSSAQLPSPDQFGQAAEKTAPAKTDTARNFSEENEQTARQPLFKDIAVSLTI